MPSRWKRQMIEWIGTLMARNGFGTATKLDGQYEGETNRGDLMLSCLMKPLNSICAAGESIRKDQRDRYKKELESAMKDLEQMYVNADDFFDKLTQPCTMQNGSVVDAKLFLVATELAEMSDAASTNDFELFCEEFADVEIRMNHIASGLKIDVETAVESKMNKNEKREPKHGKRTNL